MIAALENTQTESDVSSTPVGARAHFDFGRESESSSFAAPRAEAAGHTQAATATGANAVNALFEQLLYRMNRGLLQYVRQCSPWIGAGEEWRRARLQELATQQQRSIAAIAELLDRRGYHINWGVFPKDYAPYNYVAIKCLWTKTANFQSQLVRRLETACLEVAEDDEAAAILQEVLTTERRIADELAGSRDLQPRSSKTVA